MDCKMIQVLLVGETAKGCVQLVDWLLKRGCECHFASTYADARTLISRIGFGLVLSSYKLQQGTAFPLLKRLIGSTATLFFSMTVENGCLWVPALIRGRRWSGAHALRPAELPEALTKVLNNGSQEELPCRL